MKMKYLLLILSVVFLQACEPEKNSFTESNAEGNVNVKITMQREAQLDPYLVTISVQAYNRPARDLSTEMYLAKAEKEVVDFDWDENGKGCIITFTEKNGEVREFKLTATENLTHLKEIGKKPI